MQFIQITKKNKIHQQNGEILDYNDSIYVVYYEDLTAFIHPYRADSMFNGEVVRTKIWNTYFIFQNDSLFGYHFDPNPNHPFPNDVRLNVDSMHEKLNQENLQLDSFLRKKPDSLFYKQNELVEVYHHLPKPGDPADYLLYLHYNRELNGIKETFSHKFDNLKKMKLFKMEIFNKEVYSEEFKKVIPKMEVVHEMREISSINKGEMFFYFKKYQSEILKNKSIQ